jgi:outer membrane protein insertion porin family
MTSHKKIDSPRLAKNIFPVWSILLSLLLFAALPSPAPLQAADAVTRFLPLNIKSEIDPHSISDRVDKDLEKALTSTKMQTISRNEAELLVDYRKAWPPPVTELKKISEQTGADNLAVGTLTVIGNQLSIDIKLFDILSPENPQYYFQTTDSLDSLPEALSLVISQMQQYIDRDFRIASIAPAGNTRIDSGAILRKISTKSGDLYSQQALRKDLVAIYQMGYFNDVQIDVEDSALGKNVIFRVSEKPVISAIVYEGIDELKEEDVKEAANLKERFILNPAKIAESKEAILQLYKTKGFYNSQVKAEITYPSDAGAEVRFKIDEGEKTFIKEISFEGNTTFDDDELLDEIETGEKWFLSWLTDSGLLDMIRIKQDVQRIIAFYNNHGFLEAKIGDPVITQEKEYLYVKFLIEEGMRFRVGTVDVTGDLLTDKETLLALLSVGREEFLNRQAVRDDIFKLTDYYSQRGYAFATIKPDAKKTADGQAMDITFSIEKGSLVYIDRITIKGNTRTRDNVIRRELRLVEGGVFDSKALTASTQNLQRLQYFEEVNITPEPSLDPDRMNIIVEVKERSTGTFSIGAGYSSVDKLIVMGQISENNFLGRGDSLSLSADVSASSARYNLAYTNPHLNDSELSWGLDLFSTEREYDDYTKDSKGGGIRVGYPLIEKIRIYGDYSYTDTDLTDVSEDASYIIRNSVDLHITSAIKVSLVRDTRNRRYGATEGSRNVASIKYGGGPLGGDAQFTKLEGSTSWYFPFLFDTTFHFKAAAGQVFENDTDKLPVYERFYLGGLTSVRGFEYAKISPVDPFTDERIGGDKMWYTNTEIIFPLLKEQGINGVIFYDTGQVLNDDEDWGSSDSIKHATGFGIRWLSPMGPLRLVWGYNLDPDPGEDDSVWDFSVGGVF